MGRDDRGGNQPKGYTLHLELRDDDGSVVGEISAHFSDEVVRGLARSAASGGSRRRESTGSSRSFRGRDDNSANARGDERSMSTEQRKLLFRLAYSLGARKDEAVGKVLESLGVERFEWATRAQASAAIDALKEQTRRRRESSNGAHHG